MGKNRRKTLPDHASVAERPGDADLAGSGGPNACRPHPDGRQPEAAHVGCVKPVNPPPIDEFHAPYSFFRRPVILGIGPRIRHTPCAIRSLQRIAKKPKRHTACAYYRRE